MTRKRPALTRFGVSLDTELLERFDRLSKRKGYAARSEALRDLMREALVEQEWKSGKEIAGIFAMVYDHHGRGLMQKLAHLEHDHGNIILSSQHIHLDHHHCLEVICLKGPPKDVQTFADQVRAVKGVKFGRLTAVSTTREIP